MRTYMAEIVAIKGSGSGLVVHMDKSASFEDVRSSIAQKFQSSKKFFNSGTLAISFAGRELSDEETDKLKAVIIAELGNAEVQFVPYEMPKKDIAQVDFYSVDEGLTKFHKGLVRSGQRIVSEGNLVVIGDANPGSELAAGGNVIVMGALRGIVHAGCKGNRDAIVVALNLCPTQLRIADIITRSPDGQVKTDELRPELAFIKDDMIYIDDYLTKKKR